MSALGQKRTFRYPLFVRRWFSQAPSCFSPIATTRNCTELTARDIEIFKLLQQYRYLRSSYIHAFVGGASQTRFKERLGDLFHEGYIDRPAQQWDFANARYISAVYENGPGAARALREAGIIVDDRRTFPGEACHHQFLHALMICEGLASLDLGVRATPHLRFIAWPEILGRAPEATRAFRTPFRLPVPSGSYLMPDGLFGLEYGGAKKAYRFFAFEADRGTMPVDRSDGRQTSYLKKMAGYREIIGSQIHRSHWGVPNLLVLTLTRGEARMTGIVRRLEAQTSDTSPLLFKSVSASGLAVPAPQLLFEPWYRACLPPLRISETSDST